MQIVQIAERGFVCDFAHHLFSWQLLGDALLLQSESLETRIDSQTWRTRKGLCLFVSILGLPIETYSKHSSGST